MKKNTKGVSARGKLLWQFGTALAASYLLVHLKVIDTQIFIKVRDKLLKARVVKVPFQ